MDTSRVTRFEIINHTPCSECDGTGRITVSYQRLGDKGPYPREVECPDCYGIGSPGRTVYVHNENLQFDVQLQDDGRTLKVFIHER